MAIKIVRRDIAELQRKNNFLQSELNAANTRNDDLEAAVVELAELLVEHDDAIVELAELITEEV